MKREDIGVWRQWSVGLSGSCFGYRPFAPAHIVVPILASDCPLLPSKRARFPDCHSEPDRRLSTQARRYVRVGACPLLGRRPHRFDGCLRGAQRSRRKWPVRAEAEWRLWDVESEIADVRDLTKAQRISSPIRHSHHISVPIKLGLDRVAQGTTRMRPKCCSEMTTALTASPA